MISDKFDRSEIFKIFKKYLVFVEGWMDG